MICKHCGSLDVVKSGIVRRTNGYLAQYHNCRSCERSFVTPLEKEPEMAPEYKPEFEPQESIPIFWSDYNEAQTQEKLLFLDILQELCSYIPQEPPRVGRPKAVLSEMMFSCVSKVYEQLSSRRATSDLEIARQRGYLNHTPHFTTVLKYLKEPIMTPILTDLIQLSAMPFRDLEETFAVDASGLSSAFYSRWFDYRYGNLNGKESKIHDWLKIHVICGTKTNIVTHIVVTDGKSHDSPIFPELVQQTAKHFRIREVSADKAYSSHKNVQLVADLGAVPLIPFKVNITGRGLGRSAWKKMFRYFQLYREEFMLHYHKRSNVESTFSMLKRKFQGRLMMKGEVGQLNEALCKVLCHNLCVLNKEAQANNVLVELRGDVDKFKSLNINSAPILKGD